MKKRALVLALAVSMFLLSGCSAGDSTPVHIFRYAENQQQNYPTTLAAEYFARLVSERTQGAITILIYPNAALGDEKSVIEQVSFGGIDFSRVSISLLSDREESLNVLMLPYLYRDSEHMWSVLDSPIGDSFLSSLEAIGLVGLAWMDAGARSFYINHPLSQLPSDLQRLTIRVQESEIMTNLVDCLGANPVQMPYGEVLPALKTGRIDAAENNLPSYFSSEHYTGAPFFLEDMHSRIPEMMICSRQLRDMLSEAEWEVIASAAAEAALYERKLWEEYEQDARNRLEAYGVQFRSLSEEEREVIREKMHPIYQTYEERYSALIRQIIEKLP